MILRLTLVLSSLLAVAASADDSFTKSLSPADFQAAGLGKQTPDELARLDALVRAERIGAAAKATEETTKVVTATVRQQVQADERKAAQKAASASMFDRVKVMLKPGTEIEYTTLDAALVPGFHGWVRGTILTLTNGQRWVVSDYSSDWRNPTDKPVHVRIVPGAMGSFFMEIESGGRPRVKFLGNSAVAPAAQPPATP